MQYHILNDGASASFIDDLSVLILLKIALSLPIWTKSMFQFANGFEGSVDTDTFSN